MKNLTPDGKGPSPITGLRLPPALRESLERLAKRKGVRLSDYIRDLLQDHVSRVERKGK